MRSLRWQILGTVVLLTGGFSFAVLYLGFLATRFPWYANLAVLLVAFVVTLALVVLLWATWGFRVARRAWGG